MDSGMTLSCLRDRRRRCTERMAAADWTETFASANRTSAASETGPSSALATSHR